MWGQLRESRVWSRRWLFLFCHWYSSACIYLKVFTGLNTMSLLNAFSPPPGKLWFREMCIVNLHQTWWRHGTWARGKRPFHFRCWSCSRGNSGNFFATAANFSTFLTISQKEPLKWVHTIWCRLSDYFPFDFYLSIMKTDMCRIVWPWQPCAVLSVHLVFSLSMLTYEKENTGHTEACVAAE